MLEGVDLRTYKKEPLKPTKIERGKLFRWKERKGKKIPLKRQQSEIWE